MTGSGFYRDSSWTVRGLAAVLAAISAMLAVLVLAAPALAGKPTGEFANFGDCPLGNQEVNQCIYSQTTSGEVKIGSTAVPITKTITLQGGIILEVEPNFTETFVNAEDGNTLSKTPETVPGGILKVVAPEILPALVRNILNEIISKGLTGVNATTEQVGKIAINRINLFIGEGTALTLPVRVHLENAFLGSKCYIGSAAHPVTLNLTSGTTSPPLPNTPIKGNPGEPHFNEAGTYVRITGSSLVDNSFAAPGAEGCGEQILLGLFTGIIDTAVDTEVGLPSTAGHNTAILDGPLENGTAEAVKASE